MTPELGMDTELVKRPETTTPLANANKAVKKNIRRLDLCFKSFHLWHRGLPFYSKNMILTVMERFLISQEDTLPIERNAIHKPPRTDLNARM